MAQEQLDIVVKLRDEASKQLKIIQGSIDSVAQQNKKAMDAMVGASAKFTAGIGALGAVLGVAGYAGIKFAADMETATVGLGTLLGSTELARQTVERLKVEASRTPFELKGLTQATQLLTSVTKDGNKAIDIILDIGEGLAAMGKGQAELDRIIVNLQQIASVGKASLVDIKQFAFAGIPVFEMLTEATGKSGEALGKFISDGGVTFSLLTEMFDKANDSGGRFFNAYRDQAGSFNQLMSNMGDTIGITSGAIAEQSGLFDAAKDAIKSFTTMLQNATPTAITFINSLKDNLPIIVGVIAGGLVPAITSATVAFIAMNAQLLPFFAVGAMIGVIIQSQMQLATTTNQSALAVANLNAEMQMMEIGGKMIAQLGGGMEKFHEATIKVHQSMQDVNIATNAYQEEISRLDVQLFNLIGIESLQQKVLRDIMDESIKVAETKRKQYEEEMARATMREKVLISSEKLIGETRYKLGYDETQKRLRLADEEIRAIEKKTDTLLKNENLSQDQKNKIRSDGFKEAQNLLNRELQYEGKVSEQKIRMLKEAGINEIAIREAVASTTEKQLGAQLQTAEKFHIANKYLLQDFLKTSAQASSKELAIYGQKYQKMATAATEFRNGLAMLFNTTIFQEIKVVVTDENTSMWEKVKGVVGAVTNGINQAKSAVQNFSATVGAISAEFDSTLSGLNAGLGELEKGSGGAGKGAKDLTDELKKQQEQVERLNESYEKNLGEISTDLAQFEEAHRQKTQSISRELSSIAEEMTKVQRAYKSFLSGEATDFGSQFVKQEESIRALEESLADAKHNKMGADDDITRARYNEEIIALQERIEKEKTALAEANSWMTMTTEENHAKVVELEDALQRVIQDKRSATTQKQLGEMDFQENRLKGYIEFYKERETTLAEEQRRLATGVAAAKNASTNTEFGNFMDKMIAKRNEEKDKFEKELQMLTDKYNAVTDALELERKAYMKGKEDFIAIEDAMVRQHKIYMNDMYNATKEKVDDMIKQYERLAQASGSIGGGAKVSGRRATGGAVNGGESYIVGESGPEVFTPNMNGKIIPNKGMSGATVIINVGTVVGKEEYAEEVMNGVIKTLSRNGVLR